MSHREASDCAYVWSQRKQSMRIRLDKSGLACMRINTTEESEMKTGMSMIVALMIVAGLCVGCGKTDDSEAKASEQPKKSSNAAKWEPEAAPPAKDGAAPENVASNEEGKEASKEGEVRDAAKVDTTVKNALSFNVPKQYQVGMRIETAALSRDGDGFIRVPNSSIQVLDGKDAIFIDIGDDNFALRLIQVKEKKDAYSLVARNVLENERVVTEGSLKLENGLIQSMAGHEGHNHGPGGHGH